MNNPIVVSVSQVNRRLSFMLQTDESLKDICVKGEISNFTNHFKSGHLYFTLKDEDSSIKAVMFRSDAENLAFLPENGMFVQVRCSVKVFERDGIYQLYASDIRPDGVGELYRAYEQLKARLDAEGLFIRKRRIPEIPRKIAIITSETGAALQDILNILGRRYPLVKAVLIPSAVQGKDAPASLVKALGLAQTTGADVIIIGRGGGSIEDLWAFNDENVARAIFASTIPTVSAVGHETDFTIADFVSDMRAPTPSAAAELTVPDINTMKAGIIALREYFAGNVRDRISEANDKTDSAFAKIRFFSPEMRVKRAEENLSFVQKTINTALSANITLNESRLALVTEKLAVLNPLSVLARGYAVVYDNNMHAVSSAKQLKSGDAIRVKLSDGEINAVCE